MHPIDTNNLNDQAYALVEQGRLVEADKLFAQVCEIDSNNAEACMMRGAIQFELGSTEAASSLLRRAITLDPGDVEAHFTMCKLLLSLDQISEAIASGREAVNLDPEYGEAWLILSGMYGKIGQFQEAEQSSRRAITLLPDASEAEANLVSALRSQDKLDEAISLCEEIRTKNPVHPGIWYSMGLAFEDKQRLKDSEQSFAKAIELDSQFAKAYCGLGNINAMQGNKQQAMLLYQKSIEIDPHFPRVHFELGKVLLPNGTEEHRRLLRELQQDYVYKDANEAGEIANKLAKDFPYDDPEARLNLVQLFLEFDPSRLYTAEWWSNALRQYGPQELAHDKIVRSVFSAVFSWSLPAKEALEEIARFNGDSRLSSYGSGAGYWEYLLQTHYGIDVVAHDIKLNHQFIAMHEQQHSETTINPSDTVLLSWIPGKLDGDQGIESLLDQLRVGQKLVLIGEPVDSSGLPRTCGTRRFFQILRSNFEHQAKVPLVNYSYLDDCVDLYTRMC